VSLDASTHVSAVRMAKANYDYAANDAFNADVGACYAMRTVWRFKTT